ncbi:MAG: sigma-54-dependent Fis family transcriptional regulator [Actinobacteria bacterium]|nr:MAG: sigma-54-dependent Fis family transcriptional regulator [Actinomycetota bacterium]
MTRRVLVADDERNIRSGLVAGLAEDGYEVLEAASGKEALAAVAEHHPDVIILDQKMPAPNGLEVLRTLRAGGDETPVIMVTAHGGIEQAVEAMKLGATEYLAKPFDLAEVRLALEKIARVADLSAEVERLRTELDRDWDIDGIVAADTRMLDVLDTVGKVAPTNATVMVYGESGTGKELVARAVHKLSPRASKPFVSIHAGALPETLLESELFGYEKGAFTGATMAKPGRFEMANGGTLFLDEIGDITAGVQVKLLRVLQERQFERLGGTRAIEVDVRIVAATNQDLQRLIADGTFREDLYYRLNVVPITLPPLRKRPDDIPRLVAHFLEKYEAGSKRISQDAMEALATYSWPGNIRELENTIERIVILSRDDEIVIGDLPGEVRAGAPAVRTGVKGFALPDEGIDLEEVELGLVRQALERSGGSVAAAAKLLGLTPATLRVRMDRWGIAAGGD